jgi:hypothetical protein
MLLSLLLSSDAETAGSIMCTRIWADDEDVMVDGAAAAAAVAAAVGGGGLLGSGICSSTVAEEEFPLRNADCKEEYGGLLFLLSVSVIVDCVDGIVNSDCDTELMEDVPEMAAVVVPDIGSIVISGSWSCCC